MDIQEKAESPAQQEGEFEEVPLALLGRHVQSYHANNNAKFTSEYQVCIFFSIVSTANPLIICDAGSGS